MYELNLNKIYGKLDRQWITFKCNYVHFISKIELNYYNKIALFLGNIYWMLYVLF